MSSGERNNNNVAIACQGGGSHTAFTAGVLKRILREKKKKFEIVGFSGTSGGAICALLAWYGMLSKGRDEAVQLLDAFWADISASSPADMLLNNWFVGISRLSDYITVPEVSPYFYPPYAQEYLRTLIEKHVDFGRIDDLRDSTSPALFIGAVDVLSGEFRVFRSDSKNNDISTDAILASAAIPTFERAVHTGGKVYWDGLFSQNPPLRDFIKDTDIGAKPDKIWVIQINPEKRKKEPEQVKEIQDRRNELSGNLSLNQEIDFIGKVNEWIDKGYLPPEKYKKIEVERIEMLYDLDTASKLDRSPSFIKTMMTYGEEKAGEFLAGYD